MRFLATLYHIMIACLALGMILAMFVLMSYWLVDGLLTHYFGVNLGQWLRDTLGFEWRGFLHQPRNTAE